MCRIAGSDIADRRGYTGQIGEGVLLKDAANLPGDGGRRIDDRDTRAKRFLKLFFEKWEMRAAKHQLIDSGGLQRVEIPRDDSTRFGRVGCALFDQEHKFGTDLGLHTNTVRESIQDTGK